MSRTFSTAVPGASRRAAAPRRSADGPALHHVKSRKALLEAAQRAEFRTALRLLGLDVGVTR